MTHERMWEQTSEQRDDGAPQPGQTLPAAEGRFLRIDEVARRTQLTKRTLRYYEELGLLEPAQRSEGNYRLYSEADIHTLEHIKAMRDLLGLGLKEIREMAAAEMERERLRERWETSPTPAQRLQTLDAGERVIHHQLALLEEKLAGMERMRQSLRQRLERYHTLREETLRQLDENTAEAPNATTNGATQETPAAERR